MKYHIPDWPYRCCSPRPEHLSDAWAYVDCPTRKYVPGPPVGLLPTMWLHRAKIVRVQLLGKVRRPATYTISVELPTAPPAKLKPGVSLWDLTNSVDRGWDYLLYSYGPSQGPSWLERTRVLSYVVSCNRSHTIILFEYTGDLLPIGVFSADTLGEAVTCDPRKYFVALRRSGNTEWTANGKHQQWDMAMPKALRNAAISASSFRRCLTETKTSKPRLCKRGSFIHGKPPIGRWKYKFERSAWTNEVWRLWYWLRFW